MGIPLVIKYDLEIIKYQGFHEGKLDDCSDGICFRLAIAP
jgi:hypothetical protein